MQFEKATMQKWHDNSFECHEDIFYILEEYRIL